MVCFLPGFISQVDREHSDRWMAEEQRLKAEFPNDEAKVDAAMDEWLKAHPHPHRATLSDVADHIDHIRKVAGIDYIGLGSDFDGFRGGIPGLNDVSHYPDLLAELLRRGYSKSDIKKVAGENMLRVMRAVEKVAAELRRQEPPR